MITDKICVQWGVNSRHNAKGHRREMLTTDTVTDLILCSERCSLRLYVLSCYEMLILHLRPTPRRHDWVNFTCQLISLQGKYVA